MPGLRAQLWAWTRQRHFGFRRAVQNLEDVREALIHCVLKRAEELLPLGSPISRGILREYDVERLQALLDSDSWDFRAEIVTLWRREERGRHRRSR